MSALTRVRNRSGADGERETTARQVCLHHSLSLRGASMYSCNRRCLKPELKLRSSAVREGHGRSNISSMFSSNGDSVVVGMLERPRQFFTQVALNEHLGCVPSCQ